MTDDQRTETDEFTHSTLHSTHTRTATMRTLLETRAVPRFRERAGAVLRVVSPVGWTAAVLMLAAWAGAFWLGWDELAVVATSMLILIGMCMLFAIGRLDLGSELGLSAPRVVVGDTDVTGQLQVVNRRRRAAHALRLELPIGDQIAVFPVLRLPGEGVTTHQFDIPADRRTVLAVGPVTTVQGDPLGFFRRVRTWSDAEEVYVHPRTVPLPPTVMGLLRDMEGEPTLEMSPSDVAFHALREYAPGDDRRHIHWRSSAKVGKLLVRQYVDTRRTHIGIALSTDLTEYSDRDEFELAVSAAASLAVQAMMDGQTVSVAAGGLVLPATDIRVLLDHFSAVEAQGAHGSMRASLLALRSQATDATVIVTCVGREVTVPEIRRAIASIQTHVASLVVRTAIDLQPGYQVVESTTVLQIPDLERFSAGLLAVSS